MQRWLWASVAICSLGCARAAGDPDFGTTLASFNYTCNLPLSEGQRLNDSAAGVQVTDLVFEQADRIPEAVQEICPGMCDSIAQDPTFPAIIPPDAWQAICVPSCRIQTSQAVEDGLESCYTNSSEAEACEGVPAGRFCLATWRRNETVPDETPALCVLRERNGTASSSQCLAGFFCAGGGVPPISCAKGFWCPPGSSAPQACPNGSVCTLPLAAIPCNGDDIPLFKGTICQPGRTAGLHDSNRTLAPQPCPRGMFCVNGSASLCPRGYVCPAGTFEPVKCRRLDVCPPGRDLPSRWMEAALSTIMNLVVAALVFFLGLRLGVAKGLVSALVFFLLFIVFTVYELFSNSLLIDHLVFFAITLVAVAYGALVSPRLGRATGKCQMIVDLAFFTLLAVFYAVREGPMWDIVCFLFFVSLFPAVLFCYYLIADSSVRRYWVWSQLLPLALATLALLTIPVLFPLVDPFNSVVAGILILFIVGPPALRVFINWCKGPASQKEREELEAFEQHVNAPVKSFSAGRSKSWHGATPWTHGESPAQPLFTRSTSFPAETPARVMSAHVPPASGSEPASTELQIAPEEGFSQGSGQRVVDKTAIGITLRNLFLFLPTGSTILKDVSLTIPAGSSVAVMGPSGSGKSSITNVLSGRAGYGVVTGQVVINGAKNIGLSNLRGITGFVPQDDVMHRNLTVFENVCFSAELRLPQERRKVAGWAKDEAMRVITQIGLAHVKDSIIGDENKRGISGGQRKRVSIAMEFVSMPKILFLDEPTSGLDSTTSHAVVEMITQFAEESTCTSIAVIHQPRFETLCLFDQVILLAAGGFLAYAGPTTKVVQYFTEVLGATFPPIANPADTVMDIISLDSAKAMVARSALKVDAEALADPTAFGTFLAQRWRASAFRFGPADEEAVANLPELSVPRSTWGEAVVTQVRRSLLQTRREWMQFAALAVLLTIGLCSLVVGLPADQKFANVLGQPCFGLFLLLMLQGVNAQRIFGGAERVVGWREASSGVSMIFYFAGRDIAALVDIFMSSVVFTAVYWPIGPLHVTQHTMLWVTFAFTYTTWGLNYIWSVALPSNAAQMVSVVTSFVCFLLTGVQPSFSTVSERYGGIFLMALSPIRWAYGHLMWKHIEAGSEFSNPMIQYLSAAHLQDMGMPLHYLSGNSTLLSEPWTCPTNPQFLYVGLRWIGCRTDLGLNACNNDRPGMMDLPSNSFVCSTKQLFLMGAYYRFVALVCLNLTAKAHATGGGSAVEVPGTKRSSGNHLGKLLQATFISFLVALTYFEITLLMHTQ